MKKLILVLPLILTACGMSSRDSELVGQVKKVGHITPILCPDRFDVDLSLGVLRGGVGSMSSEDVWATVNDPGMLATLKKANESGQIVKVSYDVYRFVWCQEARNITKVEIAQ